MIAHFEDCFATQEFKWGGADCCLTPANVLVRLGHVDLMADWRGQYDCEASAGQILTVLGGLECAADALLQKHGYRRKNTATARDLGLVETASGQSMALFDGNFWWAKSQTGALLLPRAVVIWGKKWP